MSSDEQHSLAGERGARALDRDEEQHGPVAVGGQQVGQVVRGDVEHGRGVVPSW